MLGRAAADVPFTIGDPTLRSSSVSCTRSAPTRPGAHVDRDLAGEPATLIGIDGGPERIVAQSMPQYGTHVHFTPDSAGVVHWSEHKTFYTPVDGAELLPGSFSVAGTGSSRAQALYTLRLPE